MALFLKISLIVYNLIVTGALLYQGGASARGPEDFVLFLLLMPVALYLVSSLVPAQPSLTRRLSFALGLVTSTMILAANILGARSGNNYLLAGLILPLPTFFWGTLIGRFIVSLRGAPAKKPAVKARPSVAWEDLPREAIATESPAQSAGVGSAAAVVLNKSEETETGMAEAPAAPPVNEPSRRDFLKKAGALGIGMLAWSLLNPRRVGAAFFGSVPGPGTVAVKDTTDTKIDPAIKGLQSVTASFGITEIDDGDPAYYGFVNKDGGWYILKEDETTGDFAYRYASVANNPSYSNFSDAWADHTDIGFTYELFDDAF